MASSDAHEQIGIELKGRLETLSGMQSSSDDRLLTGHHTSQVIFLIPSLLHKLGTVIAMAWPLSMCSGRWELDHCLWLRRTSVRSR